MAREKMFRGWLVVGGAFCVLALNYGTRYSFGVFLPTLVAEYGWDPLFLSAAAGLNILAYAGGSVFTGRLSDSFAPRWLVTGGASLLAACFFLLPYMSNPYVFCLVYTIGGLGASGMGMVVCSASVGKWFIEKRGTATGIATMGIGIGTALIVPLVGMLEVQVGWHKAFLLLGVLVIVMAVVPAQILLHAAYPEDVGLSPDGAGAAAGKQAPNWRDVQNRKHGKKCSKEYNQSHARVPRAALFSTEHQQFLIIALSFALAVMAMMTVFIHGVAYAIACGIDKRSAAFAIGFLSFVGIAGQVFFGWLSDRLRHPRNASLAGFLLMADGMLILLTAGDFYTFLLFAGVFGFGYGSLAPLTPILVARIFGRERMGSWHGSVTLFLGIGGAIGPIMATLILRVTGGYAAVWLVMMFALIASAILIRLLRDGKAPCPTGHINR